MNGFTLAYMTSDGWIIEFKLGYWWTLSPGGSSNRWVASCVLDRQYDYSCNDYLIQGVSRFFASDFDTEVKQLTEAYLNTD